MAPTKKSATKKPIAKIPNLALGVRIQTAEGLKRTKLATKANHQKKTGK